MAKSLTTLLLAASFSAVTLPAADVPRPAPAFQFYTSGGSPVSLTQYKGKIVVFAFIKFTCPHCQNVAGVLSRVQAEYGAKGVQVLATDFTEERSMAPADFSNKYGGGYPVGTCGRNDANAFLQIPVMAPGYVPKLVFIDRKGAIQAQFDGADPFMTDPEKNIRAKLNAMLGAPAPAATQKKAAKGHS